MPTTTTTKKPIGSCAACNKEGAVLRCAPCRVAGVDVFFCNRTCQSKGWKTHGSVCKRADFTSSTSTVDKLLFTKKEAKILMRDFREEQEDSIVCGNCAKRASQIGQRLSICSRCKCEYYCNRDCQKAHWSQHKSRCSQYCDTMEKLKSNSTSTEMKIQSLFEKWRLQSCMIFTAAVYHALKKNSVLQQPPEKVVFFGTEFDYNAETFVLLEEPKAILISDLSQTDQDGIQRSYKDGKDRFGNYPDKVLIHFAFITCKELGEKFTFVVTVGIKRNQLDNISNDIQSMNDVRALSAKNCLRSDLFKGWAAISRNNIFIQSRYLKQSQAYSKFVFNALQLFSKRPMHKTHRIIVHFQMGTVIGQIAKFLKYEVIPISEFKLATFSSRADQKKIDEYQSKDAILILCVANEIQFSYVSHVAWDGRQTKSASIKQSKKEADKHFQELQQLVGQMSSDQLEKVSL